MSEATIQHLISISFIWSYKIIALIIGFLFAKLGYKLLIKGITGEFKFSTEFKGAKADLISVSPGTFFILMGAIIVGVSLYKGLVVEPVYNQTTNFSKQESVKENDKKPYLPKVPPKEGNYETKHDSIK
jgi:hypothetical protein